jgi:hypothetical protein
MDIKMVLKHTCFKKDDPLTPIGCRCRKFISTVEAATLITQGSAQFVIKGYKDLNIEETCTTCAGDEKLQRSCSHCKRTGKIIVTKKLPVYGEDIIITVTEKGKRLANATAKKTPRSPTVEQGHILRSVGAIGNNTIPAVERILEYEMLILKERLRLLVVKPDLLTFENAWALWVLNPETEFPMELRLEPVDDLKTHTGRRYDFGRSV